MARFSILSNTTRFESALFDIYEHLKKGANKDTLSKTLSDKYQPKEIDEAIKRLEYLQTTPPRSWLYNSMVVALITAFVFRIAMFSAMMFDLIKGDTYTASVIIISSILIMFALVLIKMNHPIQYIFSLVALLVGMYQTLNTGFDLAEQIPIAIGWIAFITIFSAQVFGLFAAWRSYKVYPIEIALTQKASEKLGLDFSKVL